MRWYRKLDKRKVILRLKKWRCEIIWIYINSKDNKYVKIFLGFRGK